MHCLCGSGIFKNYSWWFWLKISHEVAINVMKPYCGFCLALCLVPCSRGSHPTLWWRPIQAIYTGSHVKRNYSLLVPLDREGNGTPLQYSCLENPMDRGAWWAAVHGVVKSRTTELQSMGSLRVGRLSDVTFTFHFHALEKEMATHSSVLAWRTPVTGEPGGLLSMGSHRVGHDWSDLAAAAGPLEQLVLCEFNTLVQLVQQPVLCEWLNLEADPPVPTSPSNDYSPLHALMQTPPKIIHTYHIDLSVFHHSAITSVI